MKGLFIFCLILLIYNASHGQDVKLEKPPKDVGKYFPPNSKNYEFLNSMYAMSTAFTGVFLNVQEKDWKNAEKWAKSLRDNYLNIGKMVPEFDKNLKKLEIDSLMKAIQSKNIDDVRKYADAVGKSCSECHQKYKLTTKIIYSYPSFEVIDIEDPVTRTSNSFEDHMKKMNDSMKRLKIFIEDGKIDKAQTEGGNFVKRFMAVSDSCSECHDNKISQQVYYGNDIQQTVQALNKAILSKDKEEIYKRLSYISKNNCSKCHNTHQTIAELKSMLKK